MPEYIDEGLFQDKGYLDKFLDYVQEQLPEYEHREQFQTLNRISRSWAQGNVCSLHLWLGYWPEKIIYSKPYAFTPRFGVVTQQQSAIDKQFHRENTLFLKKLLEETNYSMGMLPLYYEGSKDSRYPLLAPLIEPYLETTKVSEFRNNRNEVGVEFLDRGRVDFIIRQRITHFAELKIKGKTDRYRFYFLHEGKRHKLTASACSNSQLGREVIEKINKMIDKDFHLKYLQYRREWDDNNPQFDGAFTDYFIHGKQLDYVTP